MALRDGGYKKINIFTRRREISDTVSEIQGTRHKQTGQPFNPHPTPPSTGQQPSVDPSLLAHPPTHSQLDEAAFQAVMRAEVQQHIELAIDRAIKEAHSARLEDEKM